MSGWSSPPDSSAPWCIQLLGGFKASRLGRVASFRTRKTAALLAYLSFFAGSALPRELLVEALWDDSPSDKGRQSLRMAVSSIRASLSASDWSPESYLRSDRETVELSPDGVRTDVAEFRDLLTAGGKDSVNRVESLGRATDTYVGRLLPGFTEGWILPQSLELEERYASASCTLVGLIAELGDLPRAVAVGRRAISLCSPREDLHVALMRAYSHCGEPASAVRQYEELEQMLNDNWGETPGAEALAALEKLPRGTSQVSEAVQSGPGPAFGPVRAFFGRKGELASLRDLVGLCGSPGLVTVIGLGGTGKTRLVEHVAADLSEDYRGRLWIASLVDVNDEVRLSETLVSAVCRSISPSAEMLESVIAAIGSSPALLVLDNAEQDIPATRRVIERLLTGCSKLRILATSRIPLDISGEHLVPLAPLPLPSDARDIAALRASPCVALLNSAAQAVRPGFTVTHENAQGVLLLCQRLEGIPLAIELAAAKLSTMSPAQVIASICRRVDLAASHANVAIRHRSLETVIHWSLDLLDADERAAFSALSVCRGGFDIELATNLLGARAESMLQRLSRCSLIGWTETPYELRFGMLETVREVASQMLAAKESAQREAQRNHFDFARRLASRFPGSGADEEIGSWVVKLTVETPNVLAAIETAATGVIPADEGWEVAFALRHLLDRRGRPQLWIGGLESLLRATQGQLTSELAAKAYALTARARYAMRDARVAHTYALRAISFADLAGVSALQVACRLELVMPAILRGEFDEMEAEIKKAIALLPDLNDAAIAARCYDSLGWLILLGARPGDSESAFRQALELAERSGDPSAKASALTGIACSMCPARYDDAQPIFDRAADLASVLPDRLARCLYNRSFYDLQQGSNDVAYANIRRSIRTLSSHGIALGQAPLTIAGNILGALGRHADAVACWGRADAARRRHGMQSLPILEDDYLLRLAEAKRTLSPAEFAAAFDRFEVKSDEALTSELFTGA